ncbi:MAG: sigma-70 family RNA polymerase sigma factor [Labilithrix sp.]|nr:sigma-70 family RNA polymerase sigma factor [Labilithrix sp.]
MRESRRLPASFPRDDLYAAGVMGLLRALESAENTNEAMFVSYLGIRVRGAILDELRRHDWAPRRHKGGNEAPVVVGLDDLSPTQSAIADEAASPFEEVETRMTASALHGALRLLPAREREVIGLRYFEDASSRSVAARLGVSEARVSQLHGRAVARLRTLLEAERLAA